MDLEALQVREADERWKSGKAFKGDVLRRGKHDPADVRNVGILSKPLELCRFCGKNKVQERNKRKICVACRSVKYSKRTDDWLELTHDDLEKVRKVVLKCMCADCCQRDPSRLQPTTRVNRFGAIAVGTRSRKPTRFVVIG